MRAWLLLGVVGCAGSPRAGGIVPDAKPTWHLSADAEGRFTGAALGWSLGGEVHLYVADTAFSRQVYERLIRPRLLHDDTSIDSAFLRRRVLSLDADSLSRAAEDSVDATILAESGAVPAQLSLVRLHAPGACTEDGPVTELVYRFRRQDLGFGPRAHATVVGVLRALGTTPVSIALPGGPGGARARTLLVVTALAGSRATTHLDSPAEALIALPTLDADREDDAGEVIAVTRSPGTEPDSRVAVAVRARFGIGGDTSLVSGVALTDGAQTVLRWIVAPVRARLSASASPSPVGSRAAALRYVLHGRVVYPAGGGTLLLVDQIDDVRTRDSRVLIVDPENGRLLAAQPLALNCRDR